ncbi:MAG: hypothetical protein EOO06_00860 [Chitinophagaceae bacterium]|nr:MAG: hypothetical protein EOO06_00860 [Chitinophagaceae bacterium]
MWGSIGRSGYGNTNLDGTYDDAILGLSPNGRQYRNEATLEQRDLSGWAYWNLRKQITPEQGIPEDLYARNETESMSHTLANGQANLLKYADRVAPVKKSSKLSLEDRVLPQARRVATLTAQLVELEKSYRAGEYDISKYSLLRDLIVAKRQRAEVLLQKALAVKPEPTPSDDEDSNDDTSSPYDVDEQYAEYSGENASQNVMADEPVPEWLKTVSDENSVKKFIVKGCRAWKKAVELKHKAATYLNTLKAL